MACISVVLDSDALNIIEGALTKKMNEINSVALISGVLNGKMKNDYQSCEKALDVIFKAKESLTNQEAMVKR